MYLTGFADEAATDIDGQIKATKELGWKYIELRNIDGKNVHDISDADFDRVCEKLTAAGVGINCFGSAIANWGKSILDSFDSSLAEVRRAIPRMQKLDTKLIRIMSFAPLEDRSPDDQMEQERFKRIRKIYNMFTNEGITPVHENCRNYGGMGWTYTLRLIEEVPGLKLVFDTGNPIFTDDYTKSKPYPKQSAWEFYQHVKQHIVYIHIKDGIFDMANQKKVHTFPGEGHGDVKRILTDLLKNNDYDGGFSIEPHLAAVCHDSNITTEEQIRYNNYIEYGHRIKAMIREINAQ